MGTLTTHVLDTMRGVPAAGLQLALYRLQTEATLIDQYTTNADGRCAAPLLAGESFQPGRYRLVFQVGDYFRDADGVSQPPFLDQIPIEFYLAADGGHYHVPLLVSPWSYSTYRGS